MVCRVALSKLVLVLQTQPIALDAIAAQSAGRIITDTRELEAGDIFLALRGETFDGHSFLTTAAERGALAAIVDQVYVDSLEALAPPLPLLPVADTLAAYQAIAYWWRTQLDLPVVAITGSVGKTTTKELVAAVLAQYGQVHKSSANFNNEIGVPKTLLEMGPEHQFAVVEMGMRGRGQIALLAQIAQPDVGIITNVGTAHIGILGSEQAIAEAKCELLAEMPKSSTAVLNGDNPRLMATAPTVWRGKQICYSLEAKGLGLADLKGELVGETLVVHGLNFPLPLTGEHNALNYLAALSTVKALGLDWTPLQAGIKVEIPGGRAKRYELADDVVILDETYNAGLESMLASLKLLSQTPVPEQGRRIAVLGTMKELGDRSCEFHRQVGQRVQELGINALLVRADLAESAAMAAGAEGIALVEEFADHDALIAHLKTLIQPGDRFLFKASRAVGLETVVQALREHLA
jgi:UDP-N-acetylmuramoyl-tripeptide--D-alanyl-D-alanine ligase